jgi:hypothetical protein
MYSVFTKYFYEFRNVVEGVVGHINLLGAHVNKHLAWAVKCGEQVKISIYM